VERPSALAGAPGTKKPALDAPIDDGYWQGAPVAVLFGTFSRTYRAISAHMQAAFTNIRSWMEISLRCIKVGERGKRRSGPHANHRRITRSAPGSGIIPLSCDYAALYPKAGSLSLGQVSAHVVLSISPVLPDNYKETSYPVAVYRWHAENPTKKRSPSPFSFLENMLGCSTNAATLARITTQFQPAVQRNSWRGGTMKASLRSNHLHVTGAWTSMTIAALESPGVEVTYQTTFVRQ